MSYYGRFYRSAMNYSYDASTPTWCVGHVRSTESCVRSKIRQVVDRAARKRTRPCSSAGPGRTNSCGLDEKSGVTKTVTLRSGRVAPG